MKPRSTIATLALVPFAFGTIAAGAEQSVTKPMGASKSAAPLASPGLLNEWLRNQWPALTDWDLGGQFRVRYEVKENGGSFPNRDFRRSGADNDNSYLLLREKVHIGYTPCPWFTAYAEGRDSSATGDDRNPNPDADQFDLHQAFIRVGDAKSFPLTVKIGRQELVYGDERMIGNGDWGNIPRAFDAARLRFENPDVWVDAFVGRVVLPNNHNFNVANDYDWLSGVYASTTTLIPKQETQLYFLSRNASPKAPSAQTGSLIGLPSARDIFIFGLRVKSLAGQWNGLDYGAELAGQIGSVNQPVPGVGNQRLDHEALAASIGGGYTWTDAFGSPRVGLEYNFASGDSDPNDGRNETFENLFPTNHKLYGYMDFVGWRNIHNPRLSASIKPCQPVGVTLDYHLFWLADTHDFFYPEAGSGRGTSGPAAPGEPVSYARNPGFGSFVGSEVDLDVTYTPARWAVFRAGYGHFFTGDYVRRSLAPVGGATDADWIYIQTTLSF
jgi:hypothetical protein